MSFTNDAIDVVMALGKGVYSVGQDIMFGIKRSGEGLGLGHEGRMALIGYENRAMVSLVESFIKYGINDHRSPLYRSIVHVLEHYYSYFPEQVIHTLSKQAGIGAGYTVGRMVIGKKLATKRLIVLSSFHGYIPGALVGLVFMLGYAANRLWRGLRQQSLAVNNGKVTAIGVLVGLVLVVIGSFVLNTFCSRSRQAISVVNKAYSVFG